MWNTQGGHRWFAGCSCGWVSPAPAVSEWVALEAAAGHYVADDEAAVTAAMRRHPAGSAR